MAEATAGSVFMSQYSSPGWFASHGADNQGCVRGASRRRKLKPCAGAAKQAKEGDPDAYLFGPFFSSQFVSSAALAEPFAGSGRAVRFQRGRISSVPSRRSRRLRHEITRRPRRQTRYELSSWRRGMPNLTQVSAGGSGRVPIPRRWSSSRMARCRITHQRAVSILIKAFARDCANTPEEIARRPNRSTRSARPAQSRLLALLRRSYDRAGAEDCGGHNNFLGESLVP